MNKLLRLGEYIKHLREAEGLSQEELAKKSGFAGRAAISAIEKGKTCISVDRLLDLAAVLHTTPGKLVDVMTDEHEPDLTEGLNAENLIVLKRYADFLRATQEDNA